MGPGQGRARRPMEGRHPRGDWELYDMETDRAEQNDLAGEQPDRVRRMARMWEGWYASTDS